MSGGVTGRGRSHLEISELRSSDFLVVLRPSSHISTRLVRSLVCGIERAGTHRFLKEDLFTRKAQESFWGASLTLLGS